jgi:hypothetical protein
VTTNIQALIAEARGFTAGSHPGNARSTLINDLADALERLNEESTRWMNRALAAEAKLDQIRSVPYWFNTETREGGFDADGEEFYLIHEILTPGKFGEPKAHAPRRRRNA